MSELPDSWTVLPIGEVNQFTGSTLNPATRPDEIFELYSVPSFPTGSPERLRGSAIGSTKQTVLPGDVLISKINPRINRVWTVGPKGSEVQIASSEWIGFRSGAVQPAFANYYFKSPDFREILCSEVAGVGGSLTRAQPKRVIEYPIPIAPAAEQTRIANQLDTLLARIQSCNDRFDAIPALLKRFRQAVYAAATTGPWEPSTIGAISVDLRYGTSKKCDYIPTGTGVLRIPNIAEQGRIDVKDLKRAEFDANEFQKLALMEGDLLVIRSNGSVELVGKTGLVTEKGSGLLFAGYLMRLRVDRTMAVPAFIQICLSAPLQREYIERTAKSTSGVNNLNAEELRSLPLLLPPLSEQIEIVHRAKALLALADRIEARANAARTQAQRLSPLVLAKAFRGELVQQDPQDEPASALLERIVSQSTAPTAQKQPKTPRQTRAPKKAAAVTKSRQDEDVKGKPYLADHLRRLGAPTTAEALFRASELPIADFYKQLAWEVAQGHIADGGATLEARNAAG